MKATELQDIRNYWTKKYPTIDIMLYSNDEGTRYFGKMMAPNSSFDISAETVGELISQGESFLRTIK